MRGREPNVSRTILPPAYVVRREGYVLTRVCPSICLSTGGGQSSRRGGGVTPASGGGGSVQPAGWSVSGGGAGTHYTADGMPLAFTQEDFLVISVFTVSVFSIRCIKIGIMMSLMNVIQNKLNRFH